MTRRNLVIAAVAFALVSRSRAKDPPKLVCPVLIKKVQPAYTRRALTAKISGTVLLTALVDENGVPGYLHLVSGLGWGLNGKAFQAVSQWRFRPALDHGVPVPMRVPIEVVFRLKPPPVVNLPPLHRQQPAPNGMTLRKIDSARTDFVASCAE